MLPGTTHEVNYLCPTHNGKALAVGYSNGSVSIFDMASGKASITFNGHKYGITCLNYDKDCMRLVSGSKVGSGL